MFPADFEQSNHVFDKPGDMTRDECDALNTFVGNTDEGDPIVISCWKPTQEELDEVNRTGRVWVWHWGRSLQPHCVTGTNPFTKDEE